jgi:hypothetical protein
MFHLTSVVQCPWVRLRMLLSDPSSQVLITSNCRLLAVVCEKIFRMLVKIAELNARSADFGLTSFWVIAFFKQIRQRLQFSIYRNIAQVPFFATSALFLNQTRIQLMSSQSESPRRFRVYTKTGDQGVLFFKIWNARFPFMHVIVPYRHFFIVFWRASK